MFKSIGAISILVGIVGCQPSLSESDTSKAQGTDGLKAPVNALEEPEYSKPFTSIAFQTAITAAIELTKESESVTSPSVGLVGTLFTSSPVFSKTSDWPINPFLKEGVTPDIGSIHQGFFNDDAYLLSGYLFETINVCYTPPTSESLLGRAGIQMINYKLVKRRRSGEAVHRVIGYQNINPSESFPCESIQLDTGETIQSGRFFYTSADRLVGVTLVSSNPQKVLNVGFTETSSEVSVVEVAETILGFYGVYEAQGAGSGQAISYPIAYLGVLKSTDQAVSMGTERQSNAVFGIHSVKNSFDLGRTEIRIQLNYNRVLSSVHQGLTSLDSSYGLGAFLFAAPQYIPSNEVATCYHSQNYCETTSTTRLSVAGQEAVGIGLPVLFRTYDQFNGDQARSRHRNLLNILQTIRGLWTIGRCSQISVETTWEMNDYLSVEEIINNTQLRPSDVFAALPENLRTCPQ